MPTNRDMVVKTKPKTALLKRKYSRKDTIEEQEQEIEDLKLQQANDTAEQIEEETVPESGEERSFKKRYGDLRRHTQKQSDDANSKIAALEKQLAEATTEVIKFPKTEEDS